MSASWVTRHAFLLAAGVCVRWVKRCLACPLHAALLQPTPRQLASLHPPARRVARRLSRPAARSAHTGQSGRGRSARPDARPTRAKLPPVAARAGPHRRCPTGHGEEKRTTRGKKTDGHQPTGGEAMSSKSNQTTRKQSASAEPSGGRVAHTRLLVRSIWIR